MKVLFISNDPNILIEGAAARLRMEAYANAIGELHILLRAEKGGKIRQGSLTIHKVIVPRLLIPLIFAREIRQVVKHEGIEVVSAQDPFEYGFAAMKAVRGTGAKLHVQLHTDVFSIWFTKGATKYSPFTHMPALNRVRQGLADRVLPNANGIRVVSERIKQSLINRYGNRICSVAVIPIATSPELPASVALPEHTSSFTFIMVGRLEAEKRVEDVLLAFMPVAQRYPQIAGLMIVGEGRERKNLERLTQKLGLTPYVTFLGNRPDARGLMQSASAFVQASAYEGYGLTLIEAALARIPIITTDVGIVGEVFKGYEDVLAIPPGDPNAIKAQLIRLLENNEDRKELVEKAESAARKHLASIHASPTDIAADLAKTLT